MLDLNALTPRALTYLDANPPLKLLVMVLAIVLAAALGHFFVKHVIRRIVRATAPRLGTLAGEVLQDEILFGRLSLLVPILIVSQGIDLLPGMTATGMSLVNRIAATAVIFTTMSIVMRVMSKGNEIYSRYPIARSRPIKGYLQIASIILYAAAFVLVIATLLDKSPIVFVSGLGAMTAVILLVFRDTLLSLVAGIQLTGNDLIRVGDWIDMPQFGADGDVVDIALHVVKVQNWDKTITVIPTHKFLEHSFKNWRGMSDSGGRRIKRSISIDMNTIRFLDQEAFERLSRFKLLGSYLGEKQRELVAHNDAAGGDDVLRSNARRLTNVGTFRAYLISYLRQHPAIHQNMTFLVRQLQPTPEGLPLEIYVFVKDTRWAVYESVQADIFDHVLAVIDQFDLRLYQRPSGVDVGKAIAANRLPASLSREGTAFSS